MLVRAIKCPNCGNIIYSRALHDMRSCDCGAIAVDGGLCYERVCFNSCIIDINEIEHLDISLDISEDDLYYDWNKGVDQYGKIKESK